MLGLAFSQPYPLPQKIHYIHTIFMLLKYKHVFLILIFKIQTCHVSKFKPHISMKQQVCQGLEFLEVVKDIVSN